MVTLPAGGGEWGRCSPAPIETPYSSPVVGVLGKTGLSRSYRPGLKTQVAGPEPQEPARKTQDSKLKNQDYRGG